mmetsp:Transcript_81958/g.232042  ORF Transcript_81958/g.232042 Transcript_81958/m.232042 type:complete len:90 (+) Transcript_81958:6-275(+)
MQQAALICYARRWRKSQQGLHHVNYLRLAALLGLPSPSPFWSVPEGVFSTLRLPISLRMSARGFFRRGRGSFSPSFASVSDFMRCRSNS